MYRVIILIDGNLNYFRVLLVDSRDFVVIDGPMVELVNVFLLVMVNIIDIFDVFVMGTSNIFIGKDFVFVIGDIVLMVDLIVDVIINFSVVDEDEVFCVKVREDY